MRFHSTLSLMDLDGSQLWMRFKWELGGNRGSKLSAVVAFLSFTRSQVTQRVRIVFFFCELWRLQCLCKRFCVLKRWISNASLTVSPNPNQTTTAPSFLLCLLTTWRDEISCCSVLNYPGCNRECMRSGEERNGLCVWVWNGHLS